MLLREKADIWLCQTKEEVRNTGWLTNLVKPAHRKIPSSDK
jgi:hypothetical protein